jgi:hypothetical protein
MQGGAMSIRRAVTRRLLRGTARADLLRGWPLELCDVGGGLELGLPLAGLLDDALRSARAGRLLELVLPFEHATVDAVLAERRFSFWVEETENGFHYLAYVAG